MAFSKIASGGLDATLGDEARPNAKPIIINGDHSIVQRGISTASITGTEIYTADRWKVQISSAGTWTQTQEALTSGDKILSESYFQHADHFLRVVENQNSIQNNPKPYLDNSPIEKNSDNKVIVKDEKNSSSQQQQNNEEI